MSAKGGIRPGSGRKPGSPNKKKSAIAKEALKRGISPLEVMLEAMDAAYKTGGPIAAFPYAKDAAPYMHPRMSSVDVKGEMKAKVSGFIRMVVDPKEKKE